MVKPRFEVGQTVKWVRMCDHNAGWNHHRNQLGSTCIIRSAGERWEYGGHQEWLYTVQVAGMIDRLNIFDSMLAFSGVEPKGRSSYVVYGPRALKNDVKLTVYDEPSAHAALKDFFAYVGEEGVPVLKYPFAPAVFRAEIAEHTYTFLCQDEVP